MLTATDIDLSDVKVTMSAEVVNPPGSVDLSPWPGLVGVLRGGAFVVATANHAIPVRDVAARAAESSNVAGLADELGIPAEQVADAIAYAAEHSIVTLS